MLRYVRTAVAVVSIVALMLLFLDFTGFARNNWGWMAKIQLVPALLSLNAVAVTVLVAITLIFGRVYCSVICPLGIFQDVVIRLRSWSGGKKKSRKNRFKYQAAYTRTRLVVLTCFLMLLALGYTSLLATAIAGLVEPYSAFGRMVSQLAVPVYDGANNLLAGWAEDNGSYAFYRVTRMISFPVLVIAILTLIMIVVFAWIDGRGYCNKICPAGTILGYLSKYSLFKISIDTARCNGCHKCERNCKASCIDAGRHAVDYTRCVACMDCIGMCRQGAIRYSAGGSAKEKLVADGTDKGRRGFMAVSGFIAGSVAMKMLGKTTDGGLTMLKERKSPVRTTPVVPAGAVGLSHLRRHCTACQLCISSCPAGILKPSTDADNFMQPVMDFSGDYCRPGCTVCSNVCPDGALHAIDEAQKSSIKIGTAVVDLDLCISASAGQSCGNCARHCPAGAISMIAVNGMDPDTLRPLVDENACIGCGSCEYHCPVGTIAGMSSDTGAIHVEGIEIHRNI